MAPSVSMSISLLLVMFPVPPSISVRQNRFLIGGKGRSSFLHPLQHPNSIYKTFAHPSQELLSGDMSIAREHHHTSSLMGGAEKCSSVHSCTRWSFPGSVLALPVSNTSSFYPSPVCFLLLCSPAGTMKFWWFFMLILFPLGSKKYRAAPGCGVQKARCWHTADSPCRAGATTAKEPFCL